MKVTLRTFLGITGNGFLESYTANLYVDEWDELFEEWQPKKVIDSMKHASELEPYLDYEITDFHQTLNYGEIESQDIYVRKIEE